MQELKFQTLVFLINSKYGKVWKEHALPSPTVLNCNIPSTAAQAARGKFAYQEEKFRKGDVASPRLVPEFVLEIFKFVFINHLDYSIKWRDQFQPHVRLQYGRFSPEKQI